jgi:hypothetical protein
VDASVPEGQVPDHERVDQVCEVIRRLGNLPAALAQQIRARANLGVTIGHQWDQLLIAVWLLSDKIKAREVRVQKIENPLSYLLKTFANVPAEVAPGHREGIRDKLERLFRPPGPEPGPSHDCDRVELRLDELRAAIHGWIDKGRASGDGPAAIEARLLGHVRAHRADYYGAAGIEARLECARGEIARQLAGRTP